MPISSMTAFGAGETTHGETTYVCEIRTLNARFVEVSVRLPRSLLALEIEIINQVKATLPRGKIDVFIDVVRLGTTSEAPQLDETTLAQHLALYKQAADLSRRSGSGELSPLSYGDLLQMAGVIATDGAHDSGGRHHQGIVARRQTVESQKDGIVAAVEAALGSVKQTRRKEGAALAVAMVELLDEMERDRRSTAGLRDAVLGQLQANVRRRLDQALASLAKGGHDLAAIPSQERLAMEITLAADKADIDEELTRLATHIQEFRGQLSTGLSPGRKLDFLCQEMHREVNTMANKLVQSEVAVFTLSMKQTIERLRQQVQNIE